MALLSRTKGKAFERKIARVFREAWPGTVVRRSSQAERAFNSDVFIESGPMFLQHLWLELQDARNPTPLAKLEQAERDIASLSNHAVVRRAVVVWHRLAERAIHVTMRADVFDALRGIWDGKSYACPITVDLDDFITLLKEKCAP